MDKSTASEFAAHREDILNANSSEERKKIEDQFHKKTAGRYVSDFVLGANDGIITTFAVVAGAWGAGLSSNVIIILGFANLIADGLSMSLGNYLGTKSEREYEKWQIRRERMELEQLPKLEREETRHIFGKWGFTGTDLDRAVEIVSSNEESWLDLMKKNELGIYEEGQRSPVRHGLVTFFSFGIGAFIPLIPFLFSIFADHIFTTAVVMGGVTMFIVGVLRSRVTSINWLRAGLETVAIGAIAAVAAFFVGDLLERLLS